MSYDFGQFGPEHLKNIQEGLKLFNNENYWECHEELEHHWLEARGDNARYVYWAVIQAAAAVYHFLDLNLLGAKGLLNKAKEKIKYIENNRVETDLLFNKMNWKEFKELIISIPSEPHLDNFEALHSFKFPLTSGEDEC